MQLLAVTLKSLGLSPVNAMLAMVVGAKPMLAISYEMGSLFLPTAVEG